jgi:hypothetical protein
MPLACDRGTDVASSAKRVCASNPRLANMAENFTNFWQIVLPRATNLSLSVLPAVSRILMLLWNEYASNPH